MPIPKLLFVNIEVDTIQRYTVVSGQDNKRKLTATIKTEDNTHARTFKQT